MTDMGHEDQLREHLLDLLGGGHAHLNFDKAVAGLPPELRGTKPAGLPQTPWRLLEHLRIAQWDILRFSIDPRHVSPEFPAGYWPEGDAPPDPGAWDRTIAAFRADQKAVMDLMAYREAGARGLRQKVASEVCFQAHSRRSPGLPLVRRTGSDASLIEEFR